MIPSVTATDIRVQLVLWSLPENVSLVRAVAAAFAQTTGLDPVMDSRIRTAVSEAANNVALHAYKQGPGLLRISLARTCGQIEVTVADRGRGIRPALPSPGRAGLGLAVISAVADRAQFIAVPNGGTEVSLSFALEGRLLAPAHESGRDYCDPQPSRVSEIQVSVSPASALGPVLGRLSRAAAAQNRFLIDRVEALEEVTDQVAEIVAAQAPGPAVFSLSASERCLELRLGPFTGGSARVREALAARGRELRAAGLEDRLEMSAGSDGPVVLTLRDGRQRPGNGGPAGGSGRHEALR